MTRKIKFRAWNKHNNEMYSTCSMLSNFNPEDCSYSSETTRCIYMQFTGLLDKNGKEIYEGDIVNLSSWEPSVYQIAWDRGAFYLAKANLEEVGDIKYAEGGEIIGNIYENPELLENNVNV